MKLLYREDCETLYPPGTPHQHESSWQATWLKASPPWQSRPQGSTRPREPQLVTTSFYFLRPGNRAWKTGPPCLSCRRLRDRLEDLLWGSLSHSACTPPHPRECEVLPERLGEEVYFTHPDFAATSVQFCLKSSALGAGSVVTTCHSINKNHCNFPSHLATVPYGVNSLSRKPWRGGVACE